MTVQQAFATIRDADFTSRDREFLRGIKQELMLSPAAVMLAKTAITEAAKGQTVDPEESYNQLMDTLMTMITLAFRAGQISNQPALELDPPPGAKVRVN